MSVKIEGPVTAREDSILDSKGCRLFTTSLEADQKYDDFEALTQAIAAHDSEQGGG